MAEGRRFQFKRKRADAEFRHGIQHFRDEDMWNVFVSNTIQNENSGGKGLRIEEKGDGAVLRGERDIGIVRRESERPEKRIPKDVAALRHVIDVADDAIAIWMACAEAVEPDAVGGGGRPIAWCPFWNI